MSYEAAVAWSIVRSLLAGALCWGLARVLLRAGLLNHGGTEARRESDQRSAISGQPEAADGWTPVGLPIHPQRSLYLRASMANLLPGGPRLRFGLLLVPFFIPGLVVGYAYRNASLSLVQTPLLNELLYLAIVVAQLTPVVVLALEWLPAAAMGPSASYLLELNQQAGRQVSLRQQLRALLVGELPRQITAGTIAALLCFQEVEVATLLQARGWAEWIFTKQAGGVELTEVLPFLVLPVGYGLLLTVPVLGYWAWDRLPACQTNGIHHGGTEARREAVSGRAFAAGSAVSGPRWRVGLGLVWIGVSWLLTVIWPVASLLIGAYRGRGVIQLRSGLWQEIGDALVLGVTVTLAVWFVLWGLGKSYDGHRCPSGFGRTRTSVLQSVGVILLLPGLLGSLALGLTIFEICQRMGLQPSYSPVPLVVAMVLFLLPRALAMHAMLQRNAGLPNLFLAEQATSWSGERGGRARTIAWRLQGEGRFWTLALLFWWSYLELTLPALLRPAGMAPAPLRLYNFLHYGHIPGLAAMLGVVLYVPVVLLVVGRGLWLLVSRQRNSRQALGSRL